MVKKINKAWGPKSYYDYCNADPRCDYPFEPCGAGYCVSYARHVDHTLGHQLDCSRCEFWKEGSESTSCVERGRVVFKKNSVISAFPCTGKTWLFENPPEGMRIADSDSSLFSWESPGVRHPDWPTNYVSHIQAMLDNECIVLVSSHKEVRDALVQYRIPFTLVYPRYDLRKVYWQRAKDRGSPPEFVKMLDYKWDEFMADLNAQMNCEKFILNQPDSYLCDLFWPTTTGFREFAFMNPRGVTKLTID